MDWLKSLVKPSLAKTDCWNATRTPLAVAKLRSLVKAYTDAKQEQVPHNNNLPPIAPKNTTSINK